MLRPESSREGVLGSTLLNAIGQALTFMTSAVLAYYFGTQAKTDIYYYALAIFSLIAGFYSGLCSSVLIPEAMHIAEQCGKEMSMKFLNVFFWGFVGLSLCISLPILLCPVQFMVLTSRFDVEIIREHVVVVLWTLPLLTLMTVSQYLLDIITSYRLFSFGLVLALVQRTLVLFGLLFLHSTCDILAIIIASVAASVVQIGMSVWALRRELGWRFLTRPVSVEKRVVGNMCYGLLGNLGSMIGAYVPIFCLSAFPAGIVTAVNYAQRIVSIPDRLLIAQVCSVTGVRFNELVAKREYESVNALFLKATDLLLLGLVPVAAFTFLYSSEIVTVCFNRGSFDREAVKHTAQLVGFFALSLPFLGVFGVVTRLFMAFRKQKEAFWYQILYNTVLVVLLLVCIRFIGYVGYPMASLLVNGLSLVALLGLMRRNFPEIDYCSSLGKFLTGIVINGCIAVGVAAFAKWFVPCNGSVSLIAGAAVYLVLLTACIWILPVRFRIGVSVLGDGRHPKVALRP